MYRFSIIIPNYNEEKYIKRCLDSIFTQTFDNTNYEVIVIDDGSSDNSLDIIKKYNVKLFYTNRQGAGGARNIGLDNAKGEYIILLDADDYLYSENILYKLDSTLNNEDIVFVKCKQVTQSSEKIIEEDNSNTLDELIYKSDYFCCTLKCFKRKIANDIRYKSRCYHEDISFTLELMCKANTFLYFEDILYVYYKQENTGTVDNYTIRKAIDFTTQTLEYLYLLDKYRNKSPAILNRINKENYILKINKLIDWAKNDSPYTYKLFKNNKQYL